MSFGAKFVGNAGQVIIDQDHPCLHLVASGTYPATNAQIINVSYPSPVQSPLPPFVFFCPNGSHHITMFQHAGSAGNWTGFSFYVKVLQDTSGVVLGGKWKACAVFMPKTGGWGMQIFDNQSRVVFDSNRDLVRFISGTQMLNYYGTNGNYLGYYTLHSWSAPWPHGTDGYFLVSHFNVQAQPPQGDTGECSIGFVTSARNTVVATVQVGGPGQDAIRTPFPWPLLAIA